MDLSLRVAARYLKADTIGDPASLILNFEKAVNWLASIEKDLPWMWEAKKPYEEFWAAPEAYAAWKVVRNDPQFKAIKDYGTYINDYILKVKFAPHEFQVIGASLLFLAILQQYALPPKIRKAIEAAAKFHARTRAHRPKKEEALAAYEKLMATIRSHLAAAKAALAEGKPHGQEAQQSTKAGPFRLVNTGGFDDETIAEVQEVVEKSARLLAAKGLSKVLYGDVLISRTLSRANVLAFYLTNKDELFVRANLKGKHHDAIRTVCHELAHRLHFKFLKDKDALIRAMYRKIKGKSEVSKKDKIQEILKAHPVLPGDKYVERNGEEWEVSFSTWGGSDAIVNLVRKLEDPETKQSISLKARISLEGYLMNKGLVSNQEISAFVTPYAKKNHEENFAEMIAFWCQGKLPEDQEALLKEVLA